uniref:Uncharacterized protein n=1 Tax=Panagrolaimus sp. PS1159 TaxID=55785 RepID=A0AC35G221_9BILA
MDLFYSKLFRCNVKDVLFGNLTFKSSDIKILASKAESCTFSVIFVKDNNGIEIPFHKLFELLPQIKWLHLKGYPLIPSISRDTVYELIKIQHFQNIKELVLEGVPNGFEIEAFNSF